MSAILTAPLELIYPVHRFSVEDYHKMIDIGILGDEDRVELLDGKIIEMSPIGPFHAACVSKLAKFFFRHIANDYSCRQEQPITITVGSEPEPDFIVATYRKDEYATGHPHPQDIHLLIEVADKTLERDRTAKAIIYARAGIPEYWIVNLIDRQLEI
ncbi:MAG: Uma2 family endonuclease [Bacteroidota bacterium]